MTRDLIIEATQLRKTYTSGSLRVEALRAVNFAVGRGEMVAIMGPSGCGKTTMLNCLSGLDEFDGGEVRIAGTSIRDMSDNQKTEYRAKRMGFVFQVYNLLPVLSAVENVEMPLLVSGVRVGEARKRSLAALGAVHLSDWARHRPAELSGGQRQRVAVARALVNNPSIVWADEPTGALDTESAEDIMDLLTQLNQEQGQTVVMVTHAIEVGERANRIVRMRDGQIERELGLTPSLDGASTPPLPPAPSPSRGGGGVLLTMPLAQELPLPRAGEGPGVRVRCRALHCPLMNRRPPAA